MFYLSQVLSTRVEDLQDVRVGKVDDVIMQAVQIGQPEPVYPHAFLIVGEDDQCWRVPFETVEWHAELDGQAASPYFRLRIPQAQLSTVSAVPSEHEILLAQQILDKQIIDVDQKRAVRVNDICFADDWHVEGIDGSSLGLLRRLAPAWVRSIAAGLHIISPNPPADIIPWQHVELIVSQHGEQSPDSQTEQEIGADGSSVARAPSGQLAELRPADLAEIVHQLTPGQGAHLIEGLDDEIAANVMQEINTERQRHILENMQTGRAVDILDAMEPDEVADLLALLPTERRQRLLRLMAPEGSEDVQELLEYASNTAGGLMTTDYIVLAQTKCVAEALEAVLERVRIHDIYAAYVYCITDGAGEEGTLLGMVSLWHLLIASPSQQLQDLMEIDIPTVQLDTDAEDVAEMIAKYNLLAVPVVNEAGVIQGIVTVDDALDVLLPPERRHRPSRMY